MPTVIWITSNLDLPCNHDDIEPALRRRIARVMKLTSPINFEDQAALDRIDGYFII
jgi:hypothetical protein